MSGPLFPEVGVIALVPDRWQPLWQSRHHVLSRLARYFPVVWVEPAREWRNALQRPSEQQARPPLPAGLRLQPAEEGPPKFYRPAQLARWASGFRLARAKRRLASAGCRSFVLYLWRPEFAEALDLLAHDLSCYHIDDEYRFYGAPEESDERERALLERVDQVFIHSLALLQKKGHVNPHSELVPNGVDYAAYSTLREEPGDLQGVPRPRLGYVGRLKKQLDWTLLLRIARENSQWSLVLVGPIASHPEAAGAMAELRELENVHWLGEKPARELPGYVQHLDVSLMPYQLDNYTQFIYPMKLHEVLATGRPIVATQLPAFEEFAEVIHLVEEPDDWQGAIERALAQTASASSSSTARQAVARRHDWDVLVDRIANTLAERLSPELALRIAPEAQRVRL